MEHEEVLSVNPEGGRNDVQILTSQEVEMTEGSVEASSSGQGLDEMRIQYTLDMPGVVEECNTICNTGAVLTYRGKTDRVIRTSMEEAEIFTLKNLTKALRLVYGNHPKFNEDFLKGLTLLYRTNTPEAVKRKKLHHGYDYEHFQFACADASEMKKILQGKEIIGFWPSNNGSFEDRCISCRTTTGVTYLHAAAMNPDHDAAVQAVFSLMKHGLLADCVRADYLGLLPIHYAVINGNERVVRMLRTTMDILCQEHTHGERQEPMTHFPVSSYVLETLLRENRVLDDVGGPSSMENRFIAHPDSLIPTALMAKTEEYLTDCEIVSATRLRKVLASRHVMGNTIIGKEILNHMSRDRDIPTLNQSILDGLLEPLRPNLNTWTPFHAVVVNPSCTVAELDEMFARGLPGIDDLDAHGREPLFYALACAKPEVVSWLWTHKHMEGGYHPCDNLGLTLEHCIVSKTLANGDELNRECLGQDIAEDISRKSDMVPGFLRIPPFMFTRMNPTAVDENLSTGTFIVEDGFLRTKPYMKAFRAIARAVGNQVALDHLKLHRR